MPADGLVQLGYLSTGGKTALTMTALQAFRDGRSGAHVRSGAVDDALKAAAFGGLPGMGVDAWSGRTAPQRQLLRRLRDHVDRALGEADDREAADRSLALLTERGTGAERQLRQ